MKCISIWEKYTGAPELYVVYTKSHLRPTINCQFVCERRVAAPEGLKIAPGHQCILIKALSFGEIMTGCVRRQCWSGRIQPDHRRIIKPMIIKEVSTPDHSWLAISNTIRKFSKTSFQSKSRSKPANYLCFPKMWLRSLVSWQAWRSLCTTPISSHDDK